MKSIVSFLCVVPMLFTLLVFPASAATVTETEYRTTLLTLIKNLQAQILFLQTQLAEQQAASYVGVYTNTATVLARYESTQNEFVVSNAIHRAYLKDLLHIVPSTYQDKLTSFVVFAAASTPYDAYVETIGPTYDTWRYGVSDEMVSQYKTEANYELMVHELGHIIAHEIGASGATYLDLYAQEFWSTNVGRDNYAHYPEWFVNEYAAQSVEEDFAEMFMYFVLEVEYIDTRRVQEKLDFFSQFREFQNLKKEINTSLK